MKKQWNGCVEDAVGWLAQPPFPLSSTVLSFPHWEARKLQTISPRILWVPDLIGILLSDVLT